MKESNVLRFLFLGDALLRFVVSYHANMLRMLRYLNERSSIIMRRSLNETQPIVLYLQIDKE